MLILITALKITGTEEINRGYWERCYIGLAIGDANEEAEQDASNAGYYFAPGSEAKGRAIWRKKND